MSTKLQPKFKKGDKITGTSGLTGLGMYEGKPYTVKECSASRMTLEECFCKATGHYFTFTPNDYDFYEKAKKPTSYREMSPDSTVKVKVGDYESEVCLGDLVHTTALLGVTNGYHGARMWDFLKNALGKDGFEEDFETIIEFREKQKRSIEYFFTPAHNKKEKESLMKDIEEQKTILKNQEEFLKELEDKYNSL